MQDGKFPLEIVPKNFKNETCNFTYMLLEIYQFCFLILFVSFSKMVFKFFC